MLLKGTITMNWIDAIAIVVGLLVFCFIGYSLAIYDTFNDRNALEDKLQLRAIEIARLKRQLQRAIAHKRPDFVLIDDPLDPHQEPSTKHQEQQSQSGT